MKFYRRSIVFSFEPLFTFLEAFDTINIGTKKAIRVNE